METKEVLNYRGEKITILHSKTYIVFHDIDFWMRKPGLSPEKLRNRKTFGRLQVIPIYLHNAPNETPHLSFTGPGYYGNTGYILCRKMKDAVIRLRQENDELYELTNN